MWVFTMAISAFTMPDPGVHDAAICLFTIPRSRCSRSSDTRIIAIAIRPPAEACVASHASANWWRYIIGAYANRTVLNVTSWVLVACPAHSTV
jgi:hypothetical protein